MNNIDLIEVLKAYRKKNDFSIREMADILHMSKSAYDRLERGLTTPTYEQSERILALVQIKPDTFREIDIKGRPVGTIAYLKHGLLCGSISTEVALNCFADLADVTGNVDLSEWVMAELYGYHKSGLQLPPYRWISVIFQMECELDSRNLFLNLPSETVYNEVDCNSEGCESGIEHLDSQWPACRGKISGIHEDSKDHLESRLKEIYGQGIKLIRVISFIPPESIQKILLAVQEILLRFVLALETDIGPNADISNLRMQKYLLGLLFRNAQDKVGSADHLVLPIKPTAPKIKLLKGDPETFVDWLEEHQISTYEMDEFYVLHEMLEQTSHPGGIVPAEMCAWAKKVTSSNSMFRVDDEKLINGLKIFYDVTR